MRVALVGAALFLVFGAFCTTGLDRWSPWAGNLIFGLLLIGPGLLVMFSRRNQPPTLRWTCG